MLGPDLAQLSFIVAMDGSDLLLTWEGGRQWVLHSSLLCFTVSERARIAEDAGLGLLPVTAHRCLVLCDLGGASVLGLVRSVQCRLLSSVGLFILLAHAAPVVALIAVRVL